MEDSIRTAILEILREAEPSRSIEKLIAESDRPYVILFLGVNGVGKTLTVAKLGWRLKREGFKVVLACSDTFRAGAIEQLRILAEEIGVRLVRHRYGSDSAAVAYDAIQHASARGLDVVLIDTAGRMQTRRNLMEEMRKIVRVAKPNLKIFVGDALTGNDLVAQSLEFDRYVGVDGSILTKVDADVRGGSIITIAYTLKKPIFFLGVGSNLEDLVEYRAEEVASTILGSIA